MKILKVKKQNLPQRVKEIVGLIRRGQVIICPTDTVYGLICDFTNKKAVRRLYQIKKRPKTKLLPVFVRNIEMAKTLMKINHEQERFLKKVWPGAVTAVFGKKKPGLRVPDYKFVLELIKRLGRPLAESSANISSKPASTKIREVLRQFEGRKHQPDLAIDAGDLKPAKPSRVIDLTGPKPKILRK